MGIGTLMFGPCGQAHMVAANAATITLTAGKYIFVQSGANSQRHMWAATSGCIQVPNPPGPAGYPPLAFYGPVTFSDAFVLANEGGVVNVQYGPISNAGFVTGAKYRADSNAIISSLGAGASYFPGSGPGFPVPGSPPFGGQYIVP